MRKATFMLLLLILLCFPCAGFCGKSAHRDYVPDIRNAIAILRANFIEGVPVQLDKLQSFLVPALSALLEDSRLVQYHKYAVTALGLIGEREAYPALFRYINNIPGKMALDRFEALLNVPLALGHLAAGGDGRALQYLLTHADFDRWADIGRISIDGFQPRGLYMVRAVLNGLGVSGNDLALKRLEGLRNSGNLIQECVGDNIAINRRVADHLGSALLSPSWNEQCLSTLLQNNVSKSPRALEGTLENEMLFQDVEVGLHAEVKLMPEKIENPLAEASSLLQTSKEGDPEDVPCAVTMRLSGRVEAFGKIGDGDAAIQCESQLLRVLCMPNSPRVKLVKLISGSNICGTKGEGSFAGCAEEPGGNIVMRPSSFGDIWAHEFGHNKGLGHRDSVRAIMSPDSTSTFEVNELECARFRLDGQRQ